MGRRDKYLKTVRRSLTSTSVYSDGRIWIFQGKFDVRTDAIVINSTQFKL